MTFKSGFRLQKGMSLIEALVTMTLTGILGMGVAYLSGQSAVAQKDMNVLGLAVGQMRGEVFSGNCASTDSDTNLTLTLAEGKGETEQKTSAVVIRAKCRSQNTPLKVQSSVEDSPYNSNGTIQVDIPRVSTSDNASEKLFGGAVTVGTVNRDNDHE